MLASVDSAGRGGKIFAPIDRQRHSNRNSGCAAVPHAPIASGDPDSPATCLTTYKVRRLKLPDNLRFHARQFPASNCSARALAVRRQPLPARLLATLPTPTETGTHRPGDILSVAALGSVGRAGSHF